MEYDGITGQLIQPFVTGGLSRPARLAFAPDDTLYVASEGNDKVLKYDGTSGALLGTIVMGSPVRGDAFRQAWLSDRTAVCMSE